MKKKYWLILFIISLVWILYFGSKIEGLTYNEIVNTRLLSAILCFVAIPVNVWLLNKSYTIRKFSDVG